MTTIMKITCCDCGKFLGVKEGHGQTGETSGVCLPCALKMLPPELHQEYIRRRELAADMEAA